MSRYNTQKKPTVQTVVNHQGGVGVKYDPKVELVGVISTGFDNSYYEKITDREKRFETLIQEIGKKDPVFVAKALVYARTVIGQRSVTHYGSVALAKLLSGSDIGKKFFSKRVRNKNSGGVIFRIDDMLEIVSLYKHLNPGKPLPNSMKKGFKAALESADSYELAKYQGKGKAVSLVDLVNLVHPKPNADMAETFKKLMNGELKQFNTVEDKNTAAGQEVAKKVKSGAITKEQAKEELKDAKESNFKDLILNEKIGYLALLRNLRNILAASSDSELLTKTCALITNKSFIEKSLVFPFQIDLALEILLTDVPTSAARNRVVVALNTAYELSIPNMIEMGLYGRTAVVIDTSGSMSSRIKLVNKNQGSASALDKGALVAATFAKGLSADVYEFSNSCSKVSVNFLDSVNTVKKQILSKASGGGTEFNSIFNTLSSNGFYDRVFIISDMQGRDSLIQDRNTSSTNQYKNYVTKHGNPHVYMVDLCGYGTTMLKPGSNVYQLFGYSSEMFEMAKKVEIDPKAIIKEIEAIEI
jgi:hypothetical protein